MAAARHHGGNDPVLNGDLGAQGLETFDMLDDWPGADLAAAWKGHLGHASAGQQGANAEEAGPQAIHQLVGRCRAID